MAVALFPLWGAAFSFAAVAALLWGAPVWVVLLTWVALASLEQRILRLSNAYLLGSALAAAGWWLAFPRLTTCGVFVTTFPAHAAARAALVALAWVSRPAARGLAISVTSKSALAAIGIGASAALTLPDRRTAALIVGAYLIVRLVREWSYRTKGGVDDTSLALVKGLTEIAAVLIYTFL